MTKRPSTTLFVARLLAMTAALSIPNVVLGMSSTPLGLEKPTGADLLEEQVRNARGEETFIHLSALKMTEINVTDRASFKGAIYPNPGQVQVNLDIVNPDGSHLETVVLTTNRNGEFKYDFAAMDAGNYAVTGSWAGNDTHLGTSAELELSVQQPSGMFIILVGDSVEEPGNPPRDRNIIARYAYNTLITRNIPPSRILFLTPDHGSVDLALGGETRFASTANLIDAIEQWAPNLVDTRSWDSARNTPLSLILLGHGFGEYLYTNENDVMSSQMLADALDNFTATTRARIPEHPSFTVPKPVPVNVVIEANRSGTFINELSGPDRFIFTSTSDDPDEWRSLMYEGGEDSFTYEFMKRVSYGFDLWRSFQYARYAMASPFQQPMLSADGDDTPNEDYDFLRVTGHYLRSRNGLGRSPNLHSFRVEHLPLSRVTELATGVSDADDDIQSVSATVIPPLGSGISTFVQLLEREDETTDVFRAEMTGLDASGVYQVFFSAIDRQGNLSNLKSTTFIVD